MKVLGSEGARITTLSKDRLAQLADQGKLACERVGPHGVRLYDVADLHRLAAERAAKRGAAGK